MKIDLQEAFIFAAQVSDPFGHAQFNEKPKEKGQDEEKLKKDLEK